MLEERLSYFCDKYAAPRKYTKILLRKYRNVGFATHSFNGW